MVIGKDARHAWRMEELKSLERAKLLRLRVISYAIALYGVLALAWGTIVIFMAFVMFATSGLGGGEGVLRVGGATSAFGFVGIVAGISAFIRTQVGRIVGILLGVFCLVGIFNRSILYFVVLTCPVPFCVLIPLLGLALFWYGGTLFGHNRYRHRDLIQALRNKVSQRSD